MAMSNDHIKLCFKNRFYESLKNTNFRRKIYRRRKILFLLNVIEIVITIDLRRRNSEIKFHGFL